MSESGTVAGLRRGWWECELQPCLLQVNEGRPLRSSRPHSVLRINCACLCCPVLAATWRSS